MTTFIVQRLLQSLIVLLLVSFIGFMLLNLVPGGPLAAYALNPGMSQADRERIISQMGLDQPLLVQYGRWLMGIVRGDWGSSFRDNREVTVIIGSRLAATLQLMVSSTLLAISIGMLAGILSAVKRYSLADSLVTTGAMIALSIPTFWFGLMAIYLFSVQLDWLPSGGMMTIGGDGGVVNRLRHLLMPMVVLALVTTATWSRYTRSSTIEVLTQDFMRTARAKGLAEHVITFKHGLRNAILPLITLAGLQLPTLFGGALVTETVFTWPGMGRLFVDSLGYRDYPVLMGILMLTAILVVIGNLAADLLYAVVDPRVRAS